MRRFVLSATAVAVAFGIGPLALADPAQAPAGLPVTAVPSEQQRAVRLARSSAFLLADIGRFRDQTWRWQRLIGRAQTPYAGSAQRSLQPAYRRWVRDLWRDRAARAWRQASNPPHEREWRCIQRYEGSWRDPNAPYWGGLQMDLSFQRSYGAELLRRKGTADKWTPLEQMWVAERAYRSGRGFYPWPNTARYCGLI
jgi:hypothetical protein